jgi:hypothetical protein
MFINFSKLKGIFGNINFEESKQNQTSEDYIYVFDEPATNGQYKIRPEKN